MGLRHSKEKVKRSKKSMSKKGRLKRPRPDGEPSTPHTEQACENYKILSCHKHSLSEGDSSALRVELPSTKPIKPDDFCSPNVDTRPQSKWTLTFETNNEKLSHLMSSLHPHIESVHLNDENGEARNIRVRLSDSFNINSLTEINPDVEPHETSRDKNENKSCIAERSRHYQQIPGMAKPGFSPIVNPDSVKDTEKKSDSMKKQSEHDNRSRSRDRACRGCGRIHSCHISAKSSRFQSPFDPRSFQQAMLLRLNELQRKSASCARTVELTLDSQSDVETRSDSEYSGDDDNRVLGDSPQRNCSRLFEPLSTQTVKSGDGGEKDLASALNRRQTISIEHHHSTPNNQTTSPVAKPWHSPVNHHQSGRKKILSKKRSSSSKRHHGYLKASSAIQTGEATFPNTPKSSSLIMNSNERVRQHRHEHFHHHYYYNCSPDT